MIVKSLRIFGIPTFEALLHQHSQPKLDKGKGPLYQAAVKAEVRLGHDRHHDLADRSRAGAGP